MAREPVGKASLGRGRVWDIVTPLAGGTEAAQRAGTSAVLGKAGRSGGRRRRRERGAVSWRGGCSQRLGDLAGPRPGKDLRGVTEATGDG